MPARCRCLRPGRDGSRFLRGRWSATSSTFPSLDTRLLARRRRRARACRPSAKTMMLMRAFANTTCCSIRARRSGRSTSRSASALATYVVGRSIHNERVKHLGTDMLSAQIVAQALTQALKFSVQRERPDGSNHHSFPSGHASATFATATVLQRHLGWKAAVPTYAWPPTSRCPGSRRIVTSSAT